MLMNILVAISLVVVTAVMHAAGFSALLRAMMRAHALEKSGFWIVTRFLIALTCGLILIHLAEIAVWGMFYFWWGCLPDLESALYFSGVTYTSAGYGDVVLPAPWRMLAPIETLTGVLMCGLSSGLFFGFVLRWITNWIQKRTASEAQSEAGQR
jgi:hypothetical protein